MCYMSPLACLNHTLLLEMQVVLGIGDTFGVDVDSRIRSFRFLKVTKVVTDNLTVGTKSDPCVKILCKMSSKKFTQKH